MGVRSLVAILALTIALIAVLGAQPKWAVFLPGLLQGARITVMVAIAGSAACSAPPALLAGFTTYEPFVLPAGYAQRIVATERNSRRAWVHVQHAGGALRNDLLVEFTKR